MINNDPNRAMCAVQLERLLGLRDVPNVPAAIEEVVRTLVACCRDEQHVAAVITELRRERFFPLPADVVEAAALFPEQPPKADDCALCRSSGWMMVRFVRTPRRQGLGWDVDLLPVVRVGSPEWDAQTGAVGQYQDIVESQAYCVCGLGRWRKGQAEQAEVEAEARRAKRRKPERVTPEDFKALAAGGE